MNTEDAIITFRRLGLTLNQARTYYALAQMGSANARSIAAKAGITRQEVYRVMSYLQEAGLVERLLNQPTMYRAVSLKQALDTLMKRKKEEDAELRRKIIELLHEAKSNHASNHYIEKTEFIISSKELAVQRMKEILRKTIRSLDVVTSAQRFSPAIIEFAKDHKLALNRGVRIRIAVEKHAPSKKVLEILHKHISKSPCQFEVKYLKEKPEAIAIIFDNREAFLALSAIAQLNEATYLYSSNRCFMALAEVYFASKWQSAVNEANY